MKRLNIIAAVSLLLLGGALFPLRRVLAQVTYPPMRVVNSGITLPLRFKTNFVNGGCVDNAGTASIDCTFAGTGTVTSIACGTAMSCSPSPIISTGTISLANTAVTAGSYTNMSATVDAQGRLTAASSGAAPALAATTISAGTGLSGGGSLAANRTISLANTAVTAGSYTSANITVDAQGRLTAAANGSGGGVTWPLTNSTSTNTYTYGGATGATAHAFDTTNAATAADDLIKVSSAGTEKLAVKYAADGVTLQADGTGSFLQIRSTDWRLAKDANNFIGYNYDIGSGFEFQIGGVITAEIQATDLGPRNDLAITGGTSARRYTEVHSRHFVAGQSAVPTATPDTGAGTGGSCTVLAHGTDTDGILEIVAGTAPAGAGATICTINFDTVFTNKPVCAPVPANSADALSALTTAVYFDYAAGSTSGPVLKNASVGGISGTSDVAYHCFDSSL